MYNDGGASSGSKVMVSRSHMVVSFSVSSPYDQNENSSFLPQLPKKTPNDPLESRCSCLETIVTLKLPDLSAVCSVVVMVLIMIHVQVMIFTVCLLSVCCMTIVTLKLPDLSAA